MLAAKLEPDILNPPVPSTLDAVLVVRLYLVKPLAWPAGVKDIDCPTRIVKNSESAKNSFRIIPKRLDWYVKVCIIWNMY